MIHLVQRAKDTGEDIPPGVVRALGPAEVIALQREVGNAATTSFISDVRRLEELRVQRAAESSAVQRAVYKSRHSEETAEMAYHGTNSAAFSGLRAAGGEILSAAEMERRGVARASGEGDIHSPQAKPKPFISAGVGEAGRGTSLAYALRSRESTEYNVRIYQYDELLEEIGKLERAPARMPDTFNPGKRYELGHLENRLRLLKAELNRRNRLPADDPSRLGGPEALTDYPIMFEFDPRGLTSVAVPREKEGPLGGEVSIYDPINLGRRLRRVYVPEAKIGTVRATLAGMLGHDRFEVLAIGKPESSSTAGRTYEATARALNDLDGLWNYIVDVFGWADG